MENYKNRLLEQKEALTKDLSEIIEKVKTQELFLEEMKDRKTLVAKELRYIEKRLEKIKEPK